ncbi:recombinase family protein [Nitrospirillum iridis]|uniref:DNA invertase Pin-like site-specific DNA recombinase n=1 Tax=Nitrospirillum iridis TaxID=765888 RepID=A0A7X0AUR9_9PROT|nr:recombinase family protein [Nitrospirillum iridis]MBB6249520.1 DNA invertase Pin-like site-specific DNA recombinase [Nitrospirillum iridis]
MTRYVAYLRVSTARQGASGLGLEAQRMAVGQFIGRLGGKLVAEVQEVESGRKNDRPRLLEALALCRVHGATLLIAKLDRLARNVAFIANLMEAGIEFVACDMPAANRLTIHVLAAVAEHEREMISARTKAALAAAKARGVKLGSPDNLANRLAGSRAGNQKKTNAAQQRAADLKPVIQEIDAAGGCSLRQIARALNDRAVRAPRGGSWSATQVRRLLRG